MNQMNLQNSMHSLLARAAAVALLAAAPAFAERPVEHSFPADADVEVSIEILSGEVEIQGWDRDMVQINGTLGDDVAELDIDVDGRRSVSIDIELPDGRYRKRHDLSARLKLSVPYGAEVEIETLSANIEITDLRGELEAESMSGEIVISGTPRVLEAETISGNVIFRGTTQELDIESVSGNVEIEGAETFVKVATVNGDIRLKAGTVRKCNLESVSGNVHFDGSLDHNADLDIAVHSSSVNLSLPGATSAQFEIDTFSGEIDNAFGPAAKRESEWMTAKTLDFTIGDGSSNVKIESFSGSVTLAKR